MWEHVHLVVYTDLFTYIHVHIHVNMLMYMCVFAQNPSNVKLPCWLIRSTNIQIKVHLIPELFLVYSAVPWKLSHWQPWVVLGADSVENRIALGESAVSKGRRSLYSPGRLTFNFIHIQFSLTLTLVFKIDSCFKIKSCPKELLVLL